jgi:hypothetical protein
MKAFKNDFPAIHDPLYFSESARTWRKLGAEMTATQVVQLETCVKANAWDLKSRALLLGYFHWQMKTKDQLLRQTWLRHLSWLVTHRPDHDLAIHFYDSFFFQGDGYREIKAIWMEQVSRNPKNAAIQCHAAGFLDLANDKELAEQVFTAAIEGNPTSLELRHNQVRLYSRWRGKELEALAAIEQMRECFPSLDALYELQQLPAIALAAGNEGKAIDAANELLEIATKKSKHWNRDRVINEAHTVLGEIALKNGNLEKARWHLYQSLPAPALLMIPSLKLARSLVLAGQPLDVISYLDNFEKTCTPYLEDAFKIHFQIEYGKIYDNVRDADDPSLRPQYERALLDHRFKVLEATEAPLLKKALESAIKHSRWSVEWWSNRASNPPMTGDDSECVNLCLNLHREHLLRLEAFRSETFAS